MYWTDPGAGKIMRADLNGGNREDVVVSPLASPRTIVLDLGAGKMYWGDRESLYRANVDGSSYEEIRFGNVLVTAISLDPVGQKIYYANRGGSTLRRVNLDGQTNLIDILTTPGRIGAIALDVAGGKVYWTDFGSSFSAEIRRANLDGTSQEVLVSGLGNNAPSTIALDLLGGKMYWAQDVGVGLDNIRRANLDGTGVEDVVAGLDTVINTLVLDVSGNKMYWTGWNDVPDNRIRRANLDGSGVETLVDASVIYPVGLALDAGSGQMYWTDRDSMKIQRATMDGTNVTDLLSGVFVSPDGIAIDMEQQKIYWADSDFGLGKIQRADFDGAHLENVLVGLVSPGGVAVDASANKLYWIDRFKVSLIAYELRIVRANRDGTGQEVLYTNPTNGSVFEPPGRITLDTSGGKMYWTETHDSQTIRRADLNGSNMEVLVALSGSIPVDVALDLAGGKLYWTDLSASRIRRANLDGTLVQDVVTNTGNVSGIALDLLTEEVYWTRQTGIRLRTIQRASLDGTGVTLLGGPDVRTPVAIALDLSLDSSDAPAVSMAGLIMISVLIGLLGASLCRRLSAEPGHPFSNQVEVSPTA
jgi:DNA-binding beta-propeller fold protein YncE